YGAAASLDAIRASARDIAAILVEPVQSSHPALQPRAFLHELSDLARVIGAALVFDETITGFRLALGGAQEWFGVRADLAIYGKVLGGGLPIGVVAGRAAYMDGVDGGAWTYADTSFPSANQTFLAGTFAKHPLAMAAADATLQHLIEAGPSLHAQLNART